MVHDAINKRGISLHQDFHVTTAATTTATTAFRTKAAVVVGLSTANSKVKFKTYLDESEIQTICGHSKNFVV